MTETVLDVRGVSKSFDGKPAVRDVSFSIERGAICGFLGPNGAGKTTTIRMILNIVQPDAGEVLVFGQPPSPAIRDRIGFLPEERGIYKRMRTEGVITFYARLKGMGAADARRRARELLHAYGLGDVAKKKVKTLSKGMAQKVQILAALANQPEFVILDEPFSGLDPVNQKILEDMIRSLRDRGATVLFSTHVMEHAERLCDRIVLVAKGRKVFDGGVNAALSRAPRRVILETDAGVDLAPILTDPRTHLARAEVVEGRQTWNVDLADGADAQELLRACVDAGVALRRFEPVKAHLHDAFVHMVGEADAADEPGAGAPSAGEPGGELEAGKAAS